MDRRALSPDSALASDTFDKFCGANTLKAILAHYRTLCSTVRLKPTHFPDFYPRLRAKLCSWRAQGLWSKFEKRASHKCYARGKACYGKRVLIIGGGPCGLRTAIEAQLLGAKVVLIEKRDRFSRNNVLHLWPFVITDLKGLGAKKFYGKFCAGSIDHISIRQLQCILLKVALLLGVEIHEGVGFEGLREPTDAEGWRAHVTPLDHPVSHYNFDVLIGADGRRNTLEGFKRKALRAKLAIAITANFINKHSEAEARVKEISGVSYIFNQKFFQELNEATGIDLENIVYYKDETHYFVMTAKKQSLLNKNVLLKDHADTPNLLSHENISREALMDYALEAAFFSTDYQLPNLEFAVNHYGQPDVAMFDFTAMYAAENACRVVQRKGQKLLMALVGDSLLEPFWPTGSGCARGFLSSFDACWMLRSWANGSKSVLEVVAERESIYRLLGQTTPENLNKEHFGYTIDPFSRYPNLNTRVVMPYQVKGLYESDEMIPIDETDAVLESAESRTTKKRRRDAVVAVDSLVSWVKEQVCGYGIEITDVCGAFVRGDVLCAIIHRFRPDLIEFPLPSEENVDPLDIAACRNQIAFDLFQEEYGLHPVMSGFESITCSSQDFLSIVAYLSQIYEIFRGEIPQIKYPRVDCGSEKESEEPEYKSSQIQSKFTRPAVLVKHPGAKPVSRRSRVSGQGRVEGELNDNSRKHKKRRSDERSRVNADERERTREEIEKNKAERQRRKIQERILQTERFIKSMRLLHMNEDGGAKEDEETFNDLSFHLYRATAPDFEERCKSLEQKLFYSGRELRGGNSCHGDGGENVTGLAKNLEEKLRGSRMSEKKPKDLIRAIGKIEKSDWNVQLIEKKIAENKSHQQGKKDRDDKVPKWSREAFDDKREAMKRKMEGSSGGDSTSTEKAFDETLKRLGNKLKEGNTLEVGLRGNNKVSQMAEQLVHKLERPKDPETKPSAARQPFEFPKKSSETCHFCKERVYVVEKMTAEGKFFHRNCFRCEYCNTSLRLGNYVFDREGRYGERFYCAPHYQLIRLNGWKKFETEKFAEGSAALESQQILSEMDERGTTPERVEFENSMDLASEEELLSEMDEDEWTDRNFGASNADNNTSDEASDLSDDDITPEGAKDDNKININNAFIGDPQTSPKEEEKSKEIGSSDSDTEVASGGEDSDEVSSVEDEEDEEEGDDEEEEEEEECEGSTTEIETDSEFAEDPPHSVPGNIPTIVVDEPEQLLARLIETSPLSVAQRSPVLGRVGERRVEVQPLRRVFPRVNPVPKRWEGASSEVQASKVALELKKKYLNHGNIPAAPAPGISNEKKSEAQSQFSHVLDMISEKQKLLQPAAKPSATMQAFLDGAEKLKSFNSARTAMVPKSMENLLARPDQETMMNHINTAKNIQALNTQVIEALSRDEPNNVQELANEEEKGDEEKRIESLFLNGAMSESLSSVSQSESQETMIEMKEKVESDEETPCESSDIDDIDIEEDVEVPARPRPPRLEVEDEFGVSVVMEGKRELSSSDSKDSLNSGLFLESEMSDWAAGPAPHSPELKHNNEAMDIVLDLDSMDFADVDGLSSPEHAHQRGYAPLHDPPDFPNSSLPTTTTNSSEDLDLGEKEEKDEGEVDEKEELRPLVASAKGAYAVLDRVVPFSNARDSLDYRKMKTSPNKSKDLYSTYVPSPPREYELQEETIQELGVEEETEEIIPAEREEEKPGSSTTSRRIDEINREREKQSDLIRSMVMGRIRRSPEKGRRGSRGSLSPIGPSSSSGSSSEQGKLEDSRRSSENSILSIPEEEKEEPMGEIEIRPQPYEPVFVSSPRFRNRPKFESPLKIYQSVTVPSTPLDAPPLSPTQVFLKSPAFYRSMPDLAKVPQEREKAREAARERARLKSDQELGLSPTYPEVPRRKVSEDEKIPKPTTLPIDPSDFSFSLRHNVDFPIKRPSGHSSPADPPTSPLKNLSIQDGEVRLRTKTPERRASPEKAKSLGWDGNPPNVFPNYFSPKEENPRPRSSTFSDIPPHFSHNPSGIDGRAMSSDTLLVEGFSSHPDARKVKKSKERERRRSLIQTVSQFFTSKSPPDGNHQALNEPSKFSLFKFAPRMQKDRRASKSREILVSPQELLGTTKKTGFISYLSQPEIIIHRLASSPTQFKSSRSSLSGKSFDDSRPTAHSTPHLANSSKRNSIPFFDPRTETPRMRELSDIESQIEQINIERQLLDTRGAAIEKKLRGEDTDEEESRDESQMMEEWFQLVREKTRLNRYERELAVRSKELQLEEKLGILEDELEQSMNISDLLKSPEEKTREADLIKEHKNLETQRGNLLANFQEEMKKYANEDFELESKIATSSLSPRESKV